MPDLNNTIKPNLHKVNSSLVPTTGYENVFSSSYVKKETEELGLDKAGTTLPYVNMTSAFHSNINLYNNSGMSGRTAIIDPIGAYSILADNQPLTSQIVKSIGRFGSEFVSSVLGGAGTIVTGLGNPYDSIRLLAGASDVTYDEAWDSLSGAIGKYLYNAGEGVREWGEEAMPIHQSLIAQQGFSLKALGDATYWTTRFPTVGSAVASFLPVAGVLGATGRLGKLVGMAGKVPVSRLRAIVKQGGIDAITSGQKLGLMGRATARGINHGLNSRTFNILMGSILGTHLDSMVEAAHTKDEQYDIALNQWGWSKEEAQEYSSEAAAGHYRNGFKSDFLLNVLQYSILFNAPKINNSGMTRNIEKAVRKEVNMVLGKLTAEELARVPSWWGRMGNRLIHPSKYVKMGVSEGFEEAFMDVAGYEGILEAKKKHDVYQEDDMVSMLATIRRTLSTYSKKGEVWDSFLFGAIGGMLLGGGRAIQQRKVMKQLKAMERERMTHALDRITKFKEKLDALTAAGINEDEIGINAEINDFVRDITKELALDNTFKSADILLEALSSLSNEELVSMGWTENTQGFIGLIKEEIKQASEAYGVANNINFGHKNPGVNRALQLMYGDALYNFNNRQRLIDGVQESIDQSHSKLTKVTRGLLGNKWYLNGVSNFINPGNRELEAEKAFDTIKELNKEIKELEQSIKEANSSTGDTIIKEAKDRIERLNKDLETTIANKENAAPELLAELEERENNIQREVELNKKTVAEYDRDISALNTKLAVLKANKKTATADSLVRNKGLIELLMDRMFLNEDILDSEEAIDEAIREAETRIDTLKQAALIDKQNNEPSMEADKNRQIYNKELEIRLLEDTKERNNRQTQEALEMYNLAVDNFSKEQRAKMEEVLEAAHLNQNDTVNYNRQLKRQYLAQQYGYRLLLEKLTSIDGLEQLTKEILDTWADAAKDSIKNYKASIDKANTVKELETIKAKILSDSTDLWKDLSTYWDDRMKAVKAQEKTNTKKEVLDNKVNNYNQKKEQEKKEKQQEDKGDITIRVSSTGSKYAIATKDIIDAVGNQISKDQVVWVKDSNGNTLYRKDKVKGKEGIPATDTVVEGTIGNIIVSDSNKVYIMLDEGGIIQDANINVEGYTEEQLLIKQSVVDLTTRILELLDKNKTNNKAVITDEDIKEVTDLLAEIKTRVLIRKNKTTNSSILKEDLNNEELTKLKIRFLQIADTLITTYINSSNVIKYYTDKEPSLKSKTKDEIRTHIKGKLKIGKWVDKGVLKQDILVSIQSTLSFIVNVQQNMFIEKYLDTRVFNKTLLDRIAALENNENSPYQHFIGTILELIRTQLIQNIKENYTVDENGELESIDRDGYRGVLLSMDDLFITLDTEGNIHPDSLIQESGMASVINQDLVSKDNKIAKVANSELTELVEVINAMQSKWNTVLEEQTKAVIDSEIDALRNIYKSIKTLAFAGGVITTEQYKELKEFIDTIESLFLNIKSKDSFVQYDKLNAMRSELTKWLDNYNIDGHTFSYTVTDTSEITITEESSTDMTTVLSSKTDQHSVVENFVQLVNYIAYMNNVVTIATSNNTEGDMSVEQTIALQKESVVRLLAIGEGLVNYDLVNIMFAEDMNTDSVDEGSVLYRTGAELLNEYNNNSRAFGLDNSITPLLFDLLQMAKMDFNRAGMNRPKAGWHINDILTYWLDTQPGDLNSIRNKFLSYYFAIQNLQSRAKSDNWANLKRQLIEMADISDTEKQKLHKALDATVQMVKAIAGAYDAVPTIGENRSNIDNAMFDNDGNLKQKYVNTFLNTFVHSDRITIRNGVNIEYSIVEALSKNEQNFDFETKQYRSDTLVYNGDTWTYKDLILALRELELGKELLLGTAEKDGRIPIQFVYKGKTLVVGYINTVSKRINGTLFTTEHEGQTVYRSPYAQPYMAAFFKAMGNNKAIKTHIKNLYKEFLKYKATGNMTEANKEKLKNMLQELYSNPEFNSSNQAGKIIYNILQRMSVINTPDEYLYMDDNGVIKDIRIDKTAKESEGVFIGSSDITNTIQLLNPLFYKQSDIDAFEWDKSTIEQKYADADSIYGQSFVKNKELRDKVVETGANKVFISYIGSPSVSYDHKTQFNLYDVVSRDEKPQIVFRGFGKNSDPDIQPTNLITGAILSNSLAYRLKESDYNQFILIKFNGRITPVPIRASSLGEMRAYNDGNTDRDNAVETNQRFIVDSIMALLEANNLTTRLEEGKLNKIGTNEDRSSFEVKRKITRADGTTKVVNTSTRAILDDMSDTIIIDRKAEGAITNPNNNIYFKMDSMYALADSEIAFFNDVNESNPGYKQRISFRTAVQESGKVGRTVVFHRIERYVVNHSDGTTKSYIRYQTVDTNKMSNREHDIVAKTEPHVNPKTNVKTWRPKWGKNILKSTVSTIKTDSDTNTIIYDERAKVDLASKLEKVVLGLVRDMPVDKQGNTYTLASRATGSSIGMVHMNTNPNEEYHSVANMYKEETTGTKSKAYNGFADYLITDSAIYSNVDSIRSRNGEVITQFDVNGLALSSMDVSLDNTAKEQLTNRQNNIAREDSEFRQLTKVFIKHKNNKPMSFGKAVASGLLDELMVGMNSASIEWFKRNMPISWMDTKLMHSDEATDFKLASESDTTKAAKRIALFNNTTDAIMFQLSSGKLQNYRLFKPYLFHELLHNSMFTINQTILNKEADTLLKEIETANKSTLTKAEADALKGYLQIAKGQDVFTYALTDKVVRNALDKLTLSKDYKSDYKGATKQDSIWKQILEIIRNILGIKSASDGSTLAMMETVFTNLMENNNTVEQEEIVNEVVETEEENPFDSLFDLNDNNTDNVADIEGNPICK
jgi:hypothetical protein